MVARAIAFPRVANTDDVCGRDLAFFRGNVEDLVATAFNDAGLVHVDVSGVRRDHALPRQQDRINDSGVCLGSAD